MGWGAGDLNLDTTVGKSRTKLLNLMALIEFPPFYICTHASVLTVLKLILEAYIADPVLLHWLYFGQVFNTGF